MQSQIDIWTEIMKKLSTLAPEQWYVEDVQQYIFKTEINGIIYKIQYDHTRENQNVNPFDLKITFNGMDLMFDNQINGVASHCLFNIGRRIVSFYKDEHAILNYINGLL